MILALATTPARRLAAVGLVALLVAGCCVPTVTADAVAGRSADRPSDGTRRTRSAPIARQRLPHRRAGAVSAATATVTMTTNFGNIVIKVDGSLGAQRGRRLRGPGAVRLLQQRHLPPRRRGLRHPGRRRQYGRDAESRT